MAVYHWCPPIIPVVVLRQSAFHVARAHIMQAQTRDKPVATQGCAFPGIRGPVSIPLRRYRVLNTSRLPCHLGINAHPCHEMDRCTGHHHRSSNISPRLRSTRSHKEPALVTAYTSPAGS
ncbi:hypothetical protein B0H21DRAFT_189187 [Amylocystis lapponica]|nr:hypothetical protein B0H21DRAFT_189187 [Amylocystis lapponica]